MSPGDFLYEDEGLDETHELVGLEWRVTGYTLHEGHTMTVVGRIIRRGIGGSRLFLVRCEPCGGYYRMAKEKLG